MCQSPPSLRPNSKAWTQSISDRICYLAQCRLHLVSPATARIRLRLLFFLWNDMSEWLGFGEQVCTTLLGHDTRIKNPSAWPALHNAGTIWIFFHCCILLHSRTSITSIASISHYSFIDFDYLFVYSLARRTTIPPFSSA